MAKEMLVNVSEGEECRIALLEDGKLEELYMERTSSTSHVGNIYKGKVTNVEPSIQAAFIDFGLGRNGFLHISDLMPTYFGRAGDDVQESVGRKLARRDRPPIQRCLRRGDEIIVQIIKEGIGTKGPTLSTYLSIPGRILVMMPGMSKFGISRKIEDEDERRRLRGILDGLKPLKDVGFIIRTAGVGKAKTEIQRDLTYLTRLWQTIQKKVKDPAPQELYTEGDLVARTVRDVFTNDVDRIVVDHKEVAKKIKEFIKIAMPRTKNKLELYEDAVPLFHKYDIEREIEQMYSRHVPLPSGGSLVIDSTEAIVAIDVNSGKFRDHSDAETTAFKTDMEAADEIPRQLRLRDLGGVIICDFIDLRYERHRRDLERRLHDNLKDDRAKTKVLRMSQFGIIEMTRQRMRPSLKRSIYFDCPHCKGAGLVKTPESMSLDVMRRLAIAANDLKVARIELAVCPDAATYLLNKKRRQLADLESHAKKKILIRQDVSLGLDEMKLTLYDLRDGLVFLESLGMSPHDPNADMMRNRPPSGRRDERGRRQSGGRNQQGQRGGPQQNRDQRGQSDDRDMDEERIEMRDADESDDRAITKSSAPQVEDEEPTADEAEEPQSSVIELDDDHEPMGEGPRGFDEGNDRGDRGGPRRRGRRGRGGRGGSNGQQNGRPPQQQQPQRQASQDRHVSQPAKPPVPPAKISHDESEEDGPSPGNERDPHGDEGAEGDQPRRRRRRGGRRHRRRRENAEAARADGQNQNANADESHQIEDSDEPSTESNTAREVDEDVKVEITEAPGRRRNAPQRTPPRPTSQRQTPQLPEPTQPPVVRTGSTDRHIVDDEPIDSPPPSRPRSYRDLDELPDDLD